MPVQGLEQAILNNIFDSAAYLFEEPGNLLKQELREPAMYNAIITAIANGASKLKEIADKTGLETSTCTKYIKALMELGIIEKETPAADDSIKKTIYYIKDTFFRFWYRFIPLTQAAIMTERIDSIFHTVVYNKLHEYMGLVFEDMCRDYLLRYADNLPIAILDAKRWWGTDNANKKQVEIDIVGIPLPGEHEYIIGSCKFRNEKISLQELELIRHYSDVFGKGTRYHYYIFSLSGFTDELLEAEHRNEVHLITLDDMYDIPR